MSFSIRVWQWIESFRQNLVNNPDRYQHIKADDFDWDQAHKLAQLYAAELELLELTNFDDFLNLRGIILFSCDKIIGVARSIQIFDIVREHISEP